MVRLPALSIVFLVHAASLPAIQAPNAIVTTRHFDLHSDPRIALHHFLIDWATADAGQWPPYAVQITERDDWQTVLRTDEQQAWSAAVAAYGATVGRSLLFDEGLLATRAWAAGVAEREDIPAPDQPFADALESALLIYGRYWWPTHDARNRAWIESVATQLAAVEGETISRFEAAYGGVWPTERTPIDLMVYANAVGAYSSAGRLTISSVPLGNQMPQAIEMIFHEASHTDPMERPLREALQHAFQVAGTAEPDRFWHDVIFYTAGEITRLVMAAHGETGYQHYGTLGVYRRGERWAVELPALEEHWRPFLESGSKNEADRRAALEALAATLGENR